MTKIRDFLHLHIPDEDTFVLRLWQALQAGGHLMTLDQVKATMAIVDHSFAPPPVQPQQG